MTAGKIENGLERGFVKHRLSCLLLITDPENSVEKTRRSRVFFFNRLRGVSISDETHFRVFDMVLKRAIILGKIQG